jgi:hypothetical protein
VRGFLGLTLSAAMNRVIHKFLEAHDRYLSLEQSRTACLLPAQREAVHIEILKAYLEVQHHARQITGLQFADGMQFAEEN